MRTSHAHLPQAAVQLYLANSEFCAALELIAHTQEVLRSELAGVASLVPGPRECALGRIVLGTSKTPQKFFCVCFALAPARGAGGGLSSSF